MIGSSETAKSATTERTDSFSITAKNNTPADIKATLRESIGFPELDAGSTIIFFFTQNGASRIKIVQDPRALNKCRSQKERRRECEKIAR
jgi:hypothetical protein